MSGKRNFSQPLSLHKAAERIAEKLRNVSQKSCGTFSDSTEF